MLLATRYYRFRSTPKDITGESHEAASLPGRGAARTGERKRGSRLEDLEPSYVQCGHQRPAFAAVPILMRLPYAMQRQGLVPKEIPSVLPEGIYVGHHRLREGKSVPIGSGPTRRDAAQRPRTMTPQTARRSALARRDSSPNLDVSMRYEMRHRDLAP